MTKLSPRLEAVAALVPRGAKVADVGTDHGYLAICLLERGIAANVVATDIRPGPLAGAKQNIAQAGLSDRISLKLCDGLDAVEPEQADVIVIAGMGGETIAGILSRAPWTLQAGKRLILSPQSKQELLREWLHRQGCGILSEHLARDAGRLYPILCAGGPAGEKPSAGELFMGCWPKETRDELFYDALRQNIRKLERERSGLYGARGEADAARLQKTEALLKELRGWEEST